MDANILTNLLKEKKISQEQLAGSIGLTRNGLARMIKSSGLRIAVLEKIADKLGVPVTHFFPEATNSLSHVNEKPEPYLLELERCKIDLKHAKDMLQSKDETIAALKRLSNNQKA